MNDNTAIFTLTVEDVQLVAKEEFNRTLTIKELEIVKDNIDTYSSWYDTVARCINQEI